MIVAITTVTTATQERATQERGTQQRKRGLLLMACIMLWCFGYIGSWRLFASARYLNHKSWISCGVGRGEWCTQTHRHTHTHTHTVALQLKLVICTGPSIDEFAALLPKLRAPLPPQPVPPPIGKEQAPMCHCRIR